MSIESLGNPVVWFTWANEMAVPRGKFRNQALMFTEIKGSLKTGRGGVCSQKVPVQLDRKM